MATKEIPEVTAHKELEAQVAIERKALNNFEEKLDKLRADLRKQEELVSKAEAEKRTSLEKFAISKASQEEVNKAKRACLETLQEREDTRDLIAYLESSVNKQKEIVAQLPRKIHAAEIAVWDKIAGVLQEQLETSLGGKAKLLWAVC